MCKLFKDAISGDKWEDEKRKSFYSKRKSFYSKRKSFYSKRMEDKLIDALNHTVPILEWYWKLHNVPMNQEELAAFRTKVSSFFNMTKNWSNKS
jgi:hypothetical protein